MSNETHRWTHSTPLVRHDTNEVIHKGDLFEPRDNELRTFGDRIEEVDTGGEDVPAESLTDLDHVGDATADKLREAGYETVADVRAADPDELAEAVDGLSEDQAAELTSGGE